MDKILLEKEGTRKFQQLSRWNAVEYTIVTRKSIHAPYTDNVNSKDDKLFLTYFRRNNHITPLYKHAILSPPIILSDGTILSRYDPETGCYLEVASDNKKVRMYKEVTA